MVDGTSGQSITYGQLSVLVDQVAGALAARGIGKGDVVAVFAPNTPYYAVVFHGILRAGATATTVNSLYTPDDVAKQLRHSGARTLFTVSAFLERATAATSQHGVRVTRPSSWTVLPATPRSPTCWPRTPRYWTSASPRPLTSPCCPTRRGRRAIRRV